MHSWRRKEDPKKTMKKALQAADAAERFAERHGIVSGREGYRLDRAWDFYRKAKAREEDRLREKRSSASRSAIEKRWGYR